MSADILVEGGTVVTLDPERRVFVGDVLLRGHKIHALGPTGKVRPRRVTQTIDARGCLVLPGFVQSHVHLCQALFRGLAEDQVLLDWLSEYIWPFEGAHTPASLRASARLGIAELLLGGTTCALDMGTVKHTDTLFRVADQTGFRLTSGKAMMDKGHIRPGGLRETTEESLRESLRLAKRWHNKSKARLRYAFAPRFILSCTDELLRTTAKMARELGCLLHTHASENPGEMEAVRAATGKDNVEALHALGCTGDNVVLAHCVWVTAKEQRVLRETGTHVAHCPSTNLKLSSGIARVPDLLQAGINVGIGADGAPCNNRMDVFTEMHLASLLQKPKYGPAAMPAQTVVEMATLGGARLLGIEDQVGSLEKGKRADVVVLDAKKPHLRPVVDPYTTVVHGARAGDVRDVFVDGQWLVRDGELTQMDLDDILGDVEREVDGVLARAGAVPRMRRP